MGSADFLRRDVFNPGVTKYIGNDRLTTGHGYDWVGDRKVTEHGGYTYIGNDRLTHSHGYDWVGDRKVTRDGSRTFIGDRQVHPWK